MTRLIEMNRHNMTYTDDRYEQKLWRTCLIQIYGHDMNYIIYRGERIRYHLYDWQSWMHMAWIARLKEVYEHGIIHMNSNCDIHDLETLGLTCTYVALHASYVSLLPCWLVYSNL